MTNQAERSPRGRWFSTTTILLAGAVVLVAAAAWMWLRPSEKPAPKKPAGDDVGEAAGIIESASKLPPPPLDSPQDLAPYAKELGRMRTYVQRHRDDVLVRPMLAQMCWWLGQYPEAETACDELFRRGTFDARLLMIKGICVRQRKGERAISFFQRAIENKGPDAEVQTEYALEALASGTPKQKEQAQTCLGEALSEGSLRAERWAEFGLRLTLAGEPKGNEYLEKGLQAGAKQPVLLAKLGLGLLQSRQEAWGRKYLSAARQGGVGGPDFLRAWGQAELLVNNVDRGRTLIDESLSLKPDQKESYDLLARSATGADAAVQAETILLRGVAACAKRDDQAWLLVRLGENRERRQNYRDAAEAYGTAAGADAQRLEGAKGAARCYLKLSRIDDAARWARVAGEAAPADAEVKQIQLQIDQAGGGAK